MEPTGGKGLLIYSFCTEGGEVVGGYYGGSDGGGCGFGSFLLAEWGFEARLWARTLLLYRVIKSCNHCYFSFRPLADPFLLCSGLLFASYSGGVILSLFLLLQRLTRSMYVSNNVFTFYFLRQAVLRYLLCVLVCMALCVIAKYKTTLLFEAKMARQVFNVANIKYCFLSNYGHSVQFLNRYGKFIYLLSTVSEMFFFT